MLPKGWDLSLAPGKTHRAHTLLRPVIQMFFQSMYYCSWKNLTLDKPAGDLRVPLLRPKRAKQYNPTDPHQSITGLKNRHRKLACH
jgi:hypothetical protein